MKELFIKKIKVSYSNDARNTPIYAYFFRYDGPDSHGYMNLMSDHSFHNLLVVLRESRKIMYSEE